jgi:hypothetical protein
MSVFCPVMCICVELLHLWHKLKMIRSLNINLVQSNIPTGVTSDSGNALICANRDSC